MTINYTCDQCQQPVTERIRLTANTYAISEQHFCSVQCVVAWGEKTGYGRQPEDDDVVDAEVIDDCPSQSSAGRECVLDADHEEIHRSADGWTWYRNGDRAHLADTAVGGGIREDRR